HFPTPGHLGLPAPGTLQRVGNQEEFAQSIGKYHGSLIASLANKVATRGNRALECDQPVTHFRAAGDCPRGSGDFLRSNQSCHVLAVEYDPACWHLQTKPSNKF